MGHQLNIFFLLFGALQGILVSLFMLKKSRNNTSSIAFTLFLIVVGFQLTFKVVTKTWLMDNVNFLYNAAYYLPYLVAPLLYLFVRTRTGGDKLQARDLVHSVPFLLGMLHLVLLRAFGYSYWWPLRYVVANGYLVMTMQLGILFMYSWLSWKRVHQLNADPVQRGLRQFIALVGISEAIIIVTLTVMYVYFPRFPDVRLFFITLTVLIYWISYKVVSQPELFTPSIARPVIELKVENTPKYSHSGLKPGESEKIASTLNAAMQKDKLFLDSSLTIDSLAVKLKISRHHLSQVLNERFNQTYFEFINNHRLEESCTRLSNPKFAHYTIAAVALDSGFSSVSNFNEVFKRRYGVTPSKFRDQSAKKLTA